MVRTPVGVLEDVALAVGDFEAVAAVNRGRCEDYLLESAPKKLRKQLTHMPKPSHSRTRCFCPNMVRLKRSKDPGAVQAVQAILRATQAQTQAQQLSDPRKPGHQTT